MVMRRTTTLLKNMESLADTMASRVGAYIAFVAAVSDNIVTIYRFDEESADAFEAFFIKGLELVANDVVVVMDIGRQPVIVGKIAQPGMFYDRVPFPLRIFADDTLALAVQKSDSTIPFRFDSIGNVLRVYTPGGRIRLGNGTTPTLTATPVGTFPGAGTSPTVGPIEGSDAAGMIGITVGTGPIAGTVMNITLAEPKPDAFYSINITPQSTAAANASVKAEKASASVWRVVSSVALGAGLVYLWHYQVMEYEQ